MSVLDAIMAEEARLDDALMAGEITFDEWAKETKAMQDDLIAEARQAAEEAADMAYNAALDQQGVRR